MIGGNYEREGTLELILIRVVPEIKYVVIRTYYTVV